MGVLPHDCLVLRCSVSQAAQCPAAVSQAAQRPAAVFRAAVSQAAQCPATQCHDVLNVAACHTAVCHA
eukprot:261976-Chlamydomonas_euryale.AAC.4